MEERELMLGIFALMAAAFGLSFMLPDGAEDVDAHDGTTQDTDDLTLELTGDNSLLDEISISDVGLPPPSSDMATVVPDEPVLETATLDRDEILFEDPQTVDVRTDTSPYENDFDVSGFELVKFAGDLDDDLVGTDKDDFLVGGRGSDSLTGGAGDDVLFGGTGSDTIVGGDGNDLIVACSNPALSDSSPASELFGGQGNDTLIGENDDLLVGGDGIDFFNIFSDNLPAGPVTYISDFDPSEESVLIEIRDGQLGGDLEFDVQQNELGVEILVNGLTVVFLEGVEHTTGLNIVAKSVGY